MYLYFDKYGVNTTKIPHGEFIRQDNPINLYVCFPLGFFENEENIAKWVVEVSFEKIDGTKTISYNLEFKGRRKFYKLKESEITFDLIDGKSYYTYHSNIMGVTDLPGRLKCIVNVYNVTNETNNFQEIVELFVEKTLGLNQPILTIKPSQYDILIKEYKTLQSKIQEFLLKPFIFNVSHLPEIISDPNDENYNFEEIRGYLYVLNGEYEVVDRLPTLPIDDFFGNKVYKYDNKFYYIQLKNDDIKEAIEIEDFEKIKGRVYNLDENANWVFVNRDIREVIGQINDNSSAETIYGVRKYTEEKIDDLKKYSDDKFVEKFKVPNSIYATNENGEIYPLPRENLAPDAFLRYKNVASFPNRGEFDKIYLDEENEIIYYWNGNLYCKINDIHKQILIINGGAE